MESDILGKATDIKDWLVNLRRDFHRHPEQSFKEYRTSKIIAQNLINMGIKVDHIGETGIVGILEGNSTFDDRPYSSGTVDLQRSVLDFFAIFNI